MTTTACLRTTGIAAWIGALCLFSTPLASQAARAGGKPNIVFLMADDLGSAHLGCYGQTKIRTPNIDRLAAEGTRFTQVYAGCSVCAPSRSVLMTGKHAGHTPVRANSGGVPLADEDFTVAEVLKLSGYTTGLFGKWGLGDAGTAGAPNQQGFDEFFGYLHQVHAHFFHPEYLWHNAQKHFLPGNKDGQRGQYSHDEIVSRALAFVERHQDQPFFLYVPFTIPHLELLVPEDSMKEYEGKFEEPAPYETKNKHYADQPKPRTALAAMISRMDRDVGRLMNKLADLGLAENTIVFFTSDNGGPDGPPGHDARFFRSNGDLRGFKGDLYEGGLRVPMIVRWPGRVKAGAVDKTPWYFADVLPTLAAIAGRHPPSGMDGVSMLPTLLGKGPPPSRECMYWEIMRGKVLAQALRQDDWKIVRHRPDAPLELYNLATDPGEKNDLAGVYPEVVAKLEKQLNKARTEPRPQKEPERPAGRSFQ